MRFFGAGDPLGSGAADAQATLKASAPARAAKAIGKRLCSEPTYPPHPPMVTLTSFWADHREPSFICAIA